MLQAIPIYKPIASPRFAHSADNPELSAERKQLMQEATADLDAFLNGQTPDSPSSCCHTAAPKPAALTTTRFTPWLQSKNPIKRLLAPLLEWVVWVWRSLKADFQQIFKFVQQPA